MCRRGKGRARRVAVPHGLVNSELEGALLRKTPAKGSIFG